MSTKSEHFIMVGVNIGYSSNDGFYDSLEPYMEKNSGKELFCLFDGMDGNYVVLGEIIHKGDEFNGMSLKGVPPIELKVMADRVKHNLKKEFGLEDVEPELIMVTHWR